MRGAVHVVSDVERPTDSLHSYVQVLMCRIRGAIITLTVKQRDERLDKHTSK